MGGANRIGKSIFEYPIISAIVNDLDKCFAGDQDAYNRIVDAFGKSIMSTEPISANEAAWMVEAIKRMDPDTKPETWVVKLAEGANVKPHVVHTFVNDVCKCGARDD